MRSSNTEGLSHWKEASKKRRVIEVASKGKKMEIKSHVMSLVLRNGGYTVSNPRFLCRLVSLVLYGPWIGPSFKCQRVYPRDCHELLSKQPDRGKNRQKGQLATIRRNASISICQTPAPSLSNIFLCKLFPIDQICRQLLLHFVILIFRFTINDGSIKIILLLIFLWKKQLNSILILIERILKTSP